MGRNCARICKLPPCRLDFSWSLYHLPSATTRRARLDESNLPAVVTIYRNQQPRISILQQQETWSFLCSRPITQQLQFIAKIASHRNTSPFPTDHSPKTVNVHFAFPSTGKTRRIDGCSRIVEEAAFTCTTNDVTAQMCQ